MAADALAAVLLGTYWARQGTRVLLVYSRSSHWRSYIEAALWCSHDESDEPMDRNHGIEDIAPETLARMVDDFRAFQEANADDIAELLAN